MNSIKEKDFNNNNGEVLKVETLESEVIEFATLLPYWAKYIAKKTLFLENVPDCDIDTSYNYLLEELELKEKTDKPEIIIKNNENNESNYKADLIFTKLENVEGVNALLENQVIDFSPSLTVIYGVNGSGKSGYVRLLKKVFYSKAPEDILGNIHLDIESKPTNAKFTFSSNKELTHLTYYEKDNAEFEQFSVFDGKGVLSQLERKNEFEFRPAGLSFFSDFTSVINNIEQKLNLDIQKKEMGNNATDLSELFEEDSEIKSIILNLNAQTKIDDLRKFTPFSVEEKVKKEKLIKEYEDLSLTIKGKEKEIKDTVNISELLGDNKNKIQKLNKYFTKEYLLKVENAVSDCNKKDIIAKKEGIENFNTHKIEEIGTVEWKNFIKAAKDFAEKQKENKDRYPESGDNCLLCHQPLSVGAEELISKYWLFIKSEAEENAKEAQEKLDKAKKFYQELNFDLFPINNTLDPLRFFRTVS